MTPLKQTTPQPKLTTCAWLLQVDYPVELLIDAILFKCGLFEPLAIQNPYCASGIVDDLFPLQVRSCQANTRSVGSEHGRKEIVSDGQASGINSVLGHQ